MSYNKQCSTAVHSQVHQLLFKMCISANDNCAWGQDKVMKFDISPVFERLPEPNRACLVGVYAFLIWNNLCDLVYQTPTKSFRYTRSRDYQTPTRHALLGSGRPPKTALFPGKLQEHFLFTTQQSRKLCHFLYHTSMTPYFVNHFKLLQVQYRCWSTMCLPCKYDDS